MLVRCNSTGSVRRHFDYELAEACAPQQYNLGLLPYGILAGGALTGKYTDGAKPEGARHTLHPTFQVWALSLRCCRAVARGGLTRV